MLSPTEIEKIIILQQNVMIAMQKQIFFLTSASNQEENKELNAVMDETVENLSKIKDILVRNSDLKG